VTRCLDEAGRDEGCDGDARADPESEDAHRESLASSVTNGTTLHHPLPEATDSTAIVASLRSFENFSWLFGGHHAPLRNGNRLGTDGLNAVNATAHPLK